MHSQPLSLTAVFQADDSALDWCLAFGIDGFGLLDLHVGLWMNSRFWKSLGYPEGDTFWPLELETGLDLETFLRGWASTHSADSPLTVRLRTPSQQVRLVDVRLRPVSSCENCFLVGCVQHAHSTFLDALHAVCDTSRDWEYCVDTTGVVQYMTPSCLDITGYPREAFYQDPGLRIRIVHEEDKPAFFGIADAINCDPIPRYEETYRIITKDGRIRTLAHACDAVMDVYNRPIGRRIVCRDITESLMLRRHLEKTEVMLEQAAGMARLGAFEVDLESYTHKWSAMTRDIHEVDDTFVPTMETALAFYAPGVYRDQMQKAVSCAIETGQGFDLETKLITAKGNERWVRAWGKVISQDGRVITLFGTLQDIDARKRAEVAALDQERLRRTLVAADLGVWEWDLREDRQWINDRWASIVGYNFQDINEAAAFRWQALVHPEDLPVLETALEAHLRSESIHFAVEFRLRHKEGRWVWVRSQGKVVDRDSGGMPVRMYGTHEEITQRKEMEAALLRTLDTLGQTSRMARVGSYELNLISQTLSWSAMTKEIHEVPPEFEPELETAIQFYREGFYRDRIQYLVERAIAHGEPYDEVLLIVTATGKERYVRAILIPEHREGVCVRLFGTFQDIDAQHRAALALQKANVSLEDSGRLARLGSWEIDLEERRIDWSDVTREIHEVADDATVPADFDLLLQSRLQFYKEGEHRTKMTEIVNESIRSGEPFDVETQITTAKGRDVWVRVIGRPHYRDGEFVRMYGIFQDIDGIKQAQEERAALHALTLRQNELLRQFAHIVSHNLRTHAGNLASVTRFLYEEHPALQDSETGGLLEPLAVSLQDTVDHLTEVARTTLHEVQAKPIVLQDAAQNAVASVRGRAREVELDFQVDISPSLVVNAVPAYLDSILLNLLSNSVKYSDPSRHSWVRLSARNDGNRIRIECEDNGVGIDLERYGSLIFGLYKTFHSNPDSRGIGLFITRTQVEAMGGSIAVESTPGVGTTFMIWLPVQDQSSGDL